MKERALNFYHVECIQYENTKLWLIYFNIYLHRKIINPTTISQQ